jgi:hypothetical protein
MGLRLIVISAMLMFAQQTPPVPQPFPRPGATPAPQQPPPAARPSGAPPPPVAAAGAEQAPTEAQLGLPIYPGAQFLRSYDAGRGQRYYIFGSAAPFVDLVAYYRATLKNKGELVFDVPATWEFDVGKYNEDLMAFPPGVTVKDFQSDVSEGFPNPKPGGQPARFKSIIQIVPVVPERK